VRTPVVRLLLGWERLVVFVSVSRRKEDPKVVAVGVRRRGVESPRGDVCFRLRSDINKVVVLFSMFSTVS